MATIDNRRILIVDDNAAIHQDFRKILGAPRNAAARSPRAAEAALFGDSVEAAAAPISGADASVHYSLDFAVQGQEALERVRAARKDQLPYALAFVDVRMPPGWDGVETARRMWEVEPDLQVVLCTAYSDYTWQEMRSRIGRTDRLVILKKPFDAIEISQLAAALTEKWNIVRRERQSLQTAVNSEMEARSLNASLETMNRALEASWAKAAREAEQRKEFLLAIASDVLAPAQAMLLGNLDLSGLQRGDMSAYLELDRSGEPLAALVAALGSIVEFASLDAGNGHAERKPCSPWALAEGVVRLAAPAAQGRGVELLISASSDLPANIETDAGLVRRILGELVANALRHTRKGSVSVEISTRGKPGEREHAVVYRVADTGPGLSRESLAHLFEPFPQEAGDGAGPRPGLGLAVCKRAAASLGGEIRLESTQESGTRFTLILPATESRATTFG